MFTSVHLNLTRVLFRALSILVVFVVFETCSEFCYTCYLTSNFCPNITTFSSFHDYCSSSQKLSVNLQLSALKYCTAPEVC